MPTLASAWTFEQPKWVEEASKEWSEREAHREEQERQTKEQQKIAEEHKAAEERSEHEAAERQQHEEAERTATQSTTAEPQVLCVVPSLRGDPLGKARAALRRAHCKPGRVTIPHAHHTALVVVAQSLASASKHPAGTAVAVTLGYTRR
jgi:sRNA-binding protein